MESFYNPTYTTVALFLFGASAIVILAGFARRMNSVRIAGLVLFGFATLSLSYGVFGTYNSRVWVDGASLVLAVVISWLAFGAMLTSRLASLGFILTPAIMLSLLFEYFFSANKVPNDWSNLDPTILAGTHVLTAVIGQAFLVSAASLAAVFLWQQKALHEKKLTVLLGVAPGLDRVKLLLLGSLWLGVIFLTTGLLTGAMYAKQYLPDPVSGLSAKIIWACLVWLLYLGVLICRHIFNYPYKKIAWLSLAGFVILVLAGFGLGFFRTIGVGV